ncbi:MAG: hypothetical protein ACP5OF_00630 [bacterium]
MKRLFILFIGLFLISFSLCGKGVADTQTPPLWEPNAVNIVAYQALLNYISQNFTGLTVNYPFSGIPDPRCPGGFSGFSYGIYPFNVQITIPGQYNNQPNLNLAWNGATQSISLVVNDIHAYINQVDGVVHAVALGLCTTCGFSISNLNADASANINVEPYIDGHYLRLKLVGTPSVNVQPIPEPSPPTVCGITIPPGAWDAIWSLIQSSITSAINSAINSMLIPQINQMLSSININLYLHGTYPPVSYQIRPSLFYQALNITNNAADISLDGGVGPATEPAPCLPLPIASPPTPTISAPTIDTARTDVMLGFGVSQDLINQALYAVYLSGMMCITTPPLPVGLLKGLIPELPSTGTLVLKIIPTQPPVLTLGSPQNMWDTVTLNGIIIEGLLGVDEAQTYPDASAAYNTQYTDAFVLSANVSIKAEVYLDQNKLDQNGNPMIVVAIDSTPGGIKINDVILASELTKPSNVNSVIQMGLSLATSFIGTALPTISSAFTFSGVTVLVKDIVPSGGYLNVYLNVTGFMNLLNLSTLSMPHIGFLSYNNPSTGSLSIMSLNDGMKPIINTRSGVVFKLNTALPEHAEISWRISDQSVLGPVWQGWSLWSTDTTIRLDNLMDGEHSLQVRIRDAQTGLTVTGDTTVFTVDTVPPELTLSKADYPYFTFNVTDAVTQARLMYAIDNQTSFTTLEPGEYTIDVGNSPVGNHTLYVKAIDEAGNTSSVVGINYTVTASVTGGCGTVPFNTTNGSMFNFVLALFIVLLFLYLCTRKEKTED